MAVLAACTTAGAPEASLPDPTRPKEIPGPTYTTTITATLTPAPGRAFGTMAAASAGDEGAVVYTESDEEGGSSHIVLQRLDAKGAVSGPPVELDTVGTTALTLATDGDRYLACWQRESAIACAGVPVGQGPAFPALTVDGASPSLAYGAGTFALAYGVPEHVAVVRVASDGSAVGIRALFATGEGTQPSAFIAAAESGFVLVDGDDDPNGNAHAHRLDSALAPIDAPIDLGMDLWFHGAAVAAYGTNVAIGLAEPYGGQIFIVDGGTVTRVHELSGGSKLGMNIALLANEASFDMLSTYNDASYGLRYRTLQGDEVIESDPALLTEHPFESSALAPLRLHGDLFLVATDGWKGEEIMVARVHRP